MLETPHVAVGAAIASKIPNPLISIPLAFASHFILDKVPHWNPHTYTETEKYGRPKNTSIAIAFIDILIALTLGLFIAYQNISDFPQALNIILCCLASVLPDVLKYPYFLFSKMRKGLTKKWVDFERSIQVDTTFVPGVLTQLTTIAAAIWWIMN